MLRIIDTETCGLQGGIVEIASVDVVDGKIVNPMSHLVRPDRPISPQAMAIHRITEAMVADKPWIEDIIPHYYGSEWYVAHNASFDRRVLPEMPGEWICTMKLSRRLWPGIKYSNMALYKSRKLNVQTPAGLHQAGPQSRWSTLPAALHYSLLSHLVSTVENRYQRWQNAIRAICVGYLITSTV